MNLSIRPIAEQDLREADRIFRLAFGTFIGLPDPQSFGGDAELVRTRWIADPAKAVGAYDEGVLVGSNFVTRWGSFGFFGPLTVRPDLWDKGVAKRLLEATMRLFEQWGTRQVGLFTFPNSPKHLALYQKFGFWPQHLTVLLSKSVPAQLSSMLAGTPPPLARAAALEDSLSSRGSQTLPPVVERLDDCRAVSESVYPGLDLESEIRAVAEQRLGDTVLIQEGPAVVGFAVCHSGRGSEGGTGATYVKFGAVTPGAETAARFARLLDACESHARSYGSARLMLGINTARHEAYRVALAHGFQTMASGVAMQRPNEAGYNRADRFVIDDWR
jgi:GNAT superfamily N-acetyltransferase